MPGGGGISGAYAGAFLSKSFALQPYKLMRRQSQAAAARNDPVGDPVGKAACQSGPVEDVLGDDLGVFGKIVDEQKLLVPIFPNEAEKVVVACIHDLHVAVS